MRLVLIRHGESEHGLQGVIAGAAGCTGLADRGHQHSQEFAAKLRATGDLRDCQALLCSPVLRTRQTAKVLVDVLPVGTLEEDCGLLEVHPGEADGLLWEDYRTRYGEFDLVTSPDRPFSPGGESWSEFLARVRSTLDRLAEQFDGQTVVAVTHAGFIVASFLVLFDIPRPGTGTRLDPEHLSITEWHVMDRKWRLVR